MARWLTQVRLRLRSLFRRAQVERELDEELRYHLEREIEEHLEAGLSSDEARLSARRKMGAIEQNIEVCRDMRRVAFIEHRIQDFRFAVRQLVKHPAFACTAILVLALGIAAGVAIFGFIDAALVRPLPYEDPSRLVTAFSTRPEEAAQKQTRGDVSYLNFLDWRARSRAFRSIGAYDVREGFTLITPDGPERVPGLRVTAGFFRTLGVTPVLGRAFSSNEEGPSAPATVMLSYSAWQTRFGGSPDVLGRTVTLQSPWAAPAEPHVVIGVLPRDFHFAMAGHADFWATIRGAAGCWDARPCRSLQTVARLGDGVSVDAASANLTAVIEQLRREHKVNDPEIARLVPLREIMLGDVRPILLMLLGAAGLVVLIACVNVMSLVLVRSDSRTREIAVRNALGASAMRLVLQFATEALVLVTVGGVLGLALAVWGMRFLTSLLGVDMLSRMPYLQGVGLNLRLVALACAVSLIAAVLLAFVPAVRVSIRGKLAGLKEASRGFAGTTWRRLGAPLVVAELTIALILLVSAGLLGKSLFQLLHVDIGFNTQQLAQVAVSLTSVQPGPGDAGRGDARHEQRGTLARQVADRIAALPGVQAVGYADQVPLWSFAPSVTFWVPGRPEQIQLKESWPLRRVSAGYFTALQTRLLRGRYFTEAEVADAPTDEEASQRSARLVVIINEAAARRYFPGQDPIGKSIAFGGAASPAREIVGIVANIQEGSLEDPAHPAAYIPFNSIDFFLVARVSQGGHSLFPSLASEIRAVRPDLLVTGPTLVEERMNGLPAAALHRSSAWLVGGFAAIAFVLSVVGLYGLVAYSVGQRTREIGVRIALGAERRSVYRLVLGEAGWLVGVGTTVGLLCAVATATLMRTLFFGVQSWDLPLLAVAALVLGVAALLASYIPARRAASVKPVEVLRAE